MYIALVEILNNSRQYKEIKKVKQVRSIIVGLLICYDKYQW